MAIVHKTSDSSLIFILLMMEERKKEESNHSYGIVTPQKVHLTNLCVCGGVADINFAYVINTLFQKGFSMTCP